MNLTKKLDLMYDVDIIVYFHLSFAFFLLFFSFFSFAGKR